MIVTFGEVMLRLSTPGYERFTQASQFNAHYGGSEANVSVSLALMGVPSCHVTVFPENDLGKSAQQSLLKEGVDTSNILFGDGRLGLYFLENGAMHRAPKIIYDRSDSAFAKLNPKDFDWHDILKDASWFHWTGITPAISASAAQACLDALTVAHELGIYVSGDINYRRNLWQYGKTAQEVMPALIDKTNLIIAGVTDFENCLGIKAETLQEASEKAKALHPSIKMVAHTHRNNISASHNKLSASLWNGSKMLISQEYDVSHIVDRVGGGDAFMAGLIYGFKNYDDHQNVIEYATAASVLKHGIPGDANLITESEIKQLMEGKNVGRLLR